VPANGLAWLLGVAWVFVAMALVTEQTPAAAVAAVSALGGLLMAVTVALVTGLAWAWILRRQADAAFAAPAASRGAWTSASPPRYPRGGR
jgi:hypothetical protein